MTVSDDIYADIKRDEGFCAKPYNDSEGLLTIGYGTLIKDGISEAEAELLLKHRFEKVFDELMARRPTVRDLPVPVIRAMANMAYNLGVPRLMGFKRMWAALEASDYETAAAEALDSQWARQVGARAGRIADLIRSAASAG